MFQFKQFTIEQDRCAMKVGTDGVLLGAWVNIFPADRHILDIGTGTGLIALMVAQRSADAMITAIDIEDISQTVDNVTASPWADRVVVQRCAVQDFVPEQKFDLIISNPPFFNESLLCPDSSRTTARHTVTLSFHDLCLASSMHLAPDGRFAVILPQSECERFLAQSRKRFVVVRRTDVSTTPKRQPTRVLLELMLRDSTATYPAQDPFDVELTIGTGAHEQFSSDYQALTRDFYLKF